MKDWACLRNAFEPYLLLTSHFVVAVVLYVSVLDSLATEV